MGNDISDLKRRLWDGHRKIEAARDNLKNLIEDLRQYESLGGDSMHHKPLMACLNAAYDIVGCQGLATATKIIQTLSEMIAKDEGVDDD